MLAPAHTKGSFFYRFEPACKCNVKVDIKLAQNVRDERRRPRLPSPFSRQAGKCTSLPPSLLPSARLSCPIQLFFTSSHSDRDNCDAAVPSSRRPSHSYNPTLLALPPSHDRTLCATTCVIVALAINLHLLTRPVGTTGTTTARIRGHVAVVLSNLPDNVEEGVVDIYTRLGRGLDEFAAELTSERCALCDSY